MGIRNDRDIETRRDERGGWQQMHGDYGRMQSREDVRGRDWRHEDRFGSQDEDRYGMMGREGRREDEDEDRGWFDRVRDTASRWFRGREDEDEDRDYERRGRWTSHDDDHMRFGRQEDWHMRDRDEDDRGWRSRTRDEDDRGWRSRSRFDRDEDRQGMGRMGMSRRGYADRDWQSDDRRMRGDEDYRRRQFASHDRDEDDRGDQFNRMRDERYTMGRRGDQGPFGRTRSDRYDERGRFGRFSGDDEQERQRYRRSSSSYGDTSGRGGHGGMGGYGNYERESQGQRFGMDRDEYGRYMPGRRDRYDRSDRDDEMRRERQHMSDRDRRR